jgi:CspA family cold shock protein
MTLTMQCHSENAAMMRGTVKFYNVQKGFGFIIPDESGQGDVFVHKSSVQWAGLPGLEKGQRLEFEIMPSLSNSKLRASNLKLLEEGKAA